jgi:hypothetical protein
VIRVPANQVEAAAEWLRVRCSASRFSRRRVLRFTISK